MVATSKIDLNEKKNMHILCNGFHVLIFMGIGEFMNKSDLLEKVLST